MNHKQEAKQADTFPYQIIATYHQTENSFKRDGTKQPATPLQTDNAMADAMINGKIHPKRTKARSIGSERMNAKNNSEFIGRLEN